MGSPHYLSPEQARGYRPTPASDVYSIGVMLYEMLTGVPPFHDPDPEVLAMKHCREEPAPLTALNPRIPSGLDWLVRKILSKEPTQRYRNGEQLGMALEQYLRHGEDGTGPFLPLAQETPIVATARGAGVAPEVGQVGAPLRQLNQCRSVRLLSLPPNPRLLRLHPCLHRPMRARSPSRATAHPTPWCGCCCWSPPSP